MRAVFLALLSSSLAIINLAHADDQILDAWKATEGKWSGALVYSDYRSGARVSIPHERTIDVGPDGTYALHANVFTDPGYQVFSAQLYHVTSEAISIASTADSGLESERLAISSIADENGFWTLLAEGEGTDNAKPAMIRLVVTISSDALRIERLVREPTETDFQFRNEIRLNREPSE